MSAFVEDESAVFLGLVSGSLRDSVGRRLPVLGSVVGEERIGILQNSETQGFSAAGVEQASRASSILVGIHSD